MVLTFIIIFHHDETTEPTFYSISLLLCVVRFRFLHSWGKTGLHICPATVGNPQLILGPVPQWTKWTMLQIRMCPQVPSPWVRIVFFKFNHMEKFVSGYYQNYKPVFSLEGQKLQYFGHLIKVSTHWKGPWCCKRPKAGGEGDNRWRDGWMASLTQWTWVWTNSRR